MYVANKAVCSVCWYGLRRRRCRRRRIYCRYVRSFCCFVVSKLIYLMRETGAIHPSNVCISCFSLNEFLRLSPLVLWSLVGILFIHSAHKHTHTRARSLNGVLLCVTTTINGNNNLLRMNCLLGSLVHERNVVPIPSNFRLYTVMAGQNDDNTINAPV